MRLLLTGAFKYSEGQLNTIQSLGYEITFIQDERVPLDTDVSEFEAVVCNSLFLYNDISKFEKLKVIQLTSAGLDRVPIDYIGEKGIKLYNAKGVYSVPMAEWIILKILEIYKKSRQFYKNQDKHNWDKQRDLLELTDKTAAIIGYGSVGYEVAKRLKAFDVKVIGVGRRKLESDLLDEYCLIDDIDMVLKKSDIVILTLPLTEETKHFIDREKITNMKEKSVLVNSSRGEIVDEAELIRAIQCEKFLGVALDVFEVEPLIENNIIWELKDTIITPHNSFVSDMVSERLYKLIIKNLGKNISSKKY